MTNDSSRADVLKIAALVGALAALAIIARLAPHPPNATPVAAIALFAASLSGRVWLGAAAAAAALFISDLGIGFYAPGVMATVYGAMILPAALGAGLLAKTRGPMRIGGAALASSLGFYLITNFAVWRFGGLYPHNLAGLMESYAMALPFLKLTMLGDLFWSAALFGSWAAIARFAATPKARA